MTVCFLPVQVLAQAGLRLHIATRFLPFDYTINNSTYVNSIYDNDTFDRCIIMPYTVTRHAKERRHRERQRYAAGMLLFDAALRRKRTFMRGGVAR